MQNESHQENHEKTHSQRNRQSPKCVGDHDNAFRSPPLDTRCLTKRTVRNFTEEGNPLAMSPKTTRSGFRPILARRTFSPAFNQWLTGPWFASQVSSRMASRSPPRKRSRFQRKRLVSSLATHLSTVARNGARGIDRDWIQAESAHLASYTNLPPGNFRFRVVAFDTTHPELKSEASVGIVKQKYYYQTWWFRCGCVLLVLALVLLGYRVHVQQIKAGFDATLKERTRIAREMHDTVIQGCTGISVLLEALQASTGRR